MSIVNGNGFSNEHGLVEPETLSEAEIQNFSGYKPEEAALIDEEYLIEREAETSERVDKSENPLIRGAIACLLTGGVMALAWLVWIIYNAKNYQQPKVATPPTPTPKPTLAPDEASQLKAELAFRNQGSREQREVSSLPTPEKTAPEFTSTPKPQVAPQPRERVRVIREPAPPPRIIREPAPPPRIIKVPQRVPIPVAQRTPFTPAPTRTPQPEIDPQVQWRLLASLGQEVAKEETPTQTPELTQTSEKIASQPTVYTEPSSPTISVVAIGANDLNKANPKEQEVNKPQSIGEYGILNRTPIGEGEDVPLLPMQVQIGTSVGAKLVVPLWVEEKSQSAGRFAVQLEEDVLSTDNRVALPKGSILITEATVSKDNKVVNQTAIAIIYTDSFGTVHQQPIPSNSILIRGEEGRPLIAKGLKDKGAQIATQDLLIALLNSAGRAGEVFNQNQTTSIISSIGFGQITSTPRKPNVLAAAVEGFFSPLARRLTQRADQSSQETLRGSNVAFVPEGTKVSVVFNSFLEVTR